MIDFDFERRKQSVAELDKDSALSLIYMWIKQGRVTVKQFKELIVIVGEKGKEL